MKDLTHGDFDDVVDLHNYWEKLNSKIENYLHCSVEAHNKDIKKRKDLEIYLGIHERQELKRNKPIDKMSTGIEVYHFFNNLVWESTLEFFKNKQKFKEQEEIRDNYYKLLNDT